MKKVFLLLVLLTVVLYGCGEAPANEPMDEPEATPNEATQDERLAEEAEIVSEPEVEAKPEKIYISDDKIVYGIGEGDMTQAEMMADCEQKGGTFNECGSPCAEGDDMCVMACAFVCELAVEDDVIVRAKDEESAQVANPASVKCLTDGGDFKLISWPEGTEGMCIFDKTSVCEEWAYFNGECSVGDCAVECKEIGTANEGWYDCNEKLLYTEIC